MIPPEKMDEIQNDLKRKEMIISRCLADAVEAGDAKKNTHGKVVVELTVSPSGKAPERQGHEVRLPGEVDRRLHVKHVEDIEFPQIPKQYPTSFTYSMEAD